MATFNLNKSVFISNNEDVDAKFRVSNDTERDNLITSQLVKKGHIIFHEEDETHYKLSTYPSEGSLTGVVWDVLGGSAEPISEGNWIRRGESIEDGGTVEYYWTSVADNLQTLSSEDITRLKSSIFSQLTRSGTRNPSTFEKGVATDITFNYTITPNDDTITSITWDGVTDSEEPFDLTGSTTSTGNTNTTLVTLAITKVEGSVGNLNLTSTALTPQWRGVSSLEEFDGTYSQLNDNLTKLVQNSDNTDQTFNMNNEYAYFISTNSNATIKDGSDFNQSVGSWGDGESEFYKKSLPVTLADGTTTILTMYRTRQTKTASPIYNLT